MLLFKNNSFFKSSTHSHIFFPVFPPLYNPDKQFRTSVKLFAAMTKRKSDKVLSPNPKNVQRRAKRQEECAAAVNSRGARSNIDRMAQHHSEKKNRELIKQLDRKPNKCECTVCNQGSAMFVTCVA